jgi:hypothetical protein
VNLYCFAKNGPAEFVDPRGLNWFTEAGHQVNCAMGNMLGKLGTLFGGDAPETDASGRKHFEYSPFILSGRAVTFGNVSIYSGSKNALTRQEGVLYPVSQHEDAHVGQSQDMGIFYVPGYIFEALAVAEMGGNWWKDHPMEQGPNCSPPVSWP